MSYDINFWKQSRKLSQTPEQIYHQLCKDQSVDGLESLPLEEICAALKGEFPSFDSTAAFPFIECDDYGIEVSSSPQHARFDLRGDGFEDAIEPLVRIMSEFECPMYDPQLNKRYDKKSGTQVGRPPKRTSRDARKRAQLHQQQEAKRLLETITAEKTTLSIDELNADDGALIALEKQFWLNDPSTMLKHATDDIVTVFPRPIGMMVRHQLITMSQVMAGSLWTDVDITDIRVTRPADGVALLLYHAEARNNEGETMCGLIASLYVRKDEEWRIALQQVTPDLPALSG